jgi:hypothetical protein
MPRANPTVGGHPEEQQPEAGNSDSELQHPGQVAIHVDCPAVTVGDRFSTFQDFKACVRLHAILNGYSIRFVKSDRLRNVVQCGGSDQCDYKVRAVWNKKEEKVKVTVVVMEHTRCLGSATPRYSSGRLHSFLKDNVPQIMTITNRTKPRDVMEAVQKHLNARLKYGSAHKVLLSLQGKDIDIERDQFRLLPAYIELLKKRDPDGRYFLSRDDNTARFQRIFVCPSACKKQFPLGPAFIAMDGTFTKNKFRQTILFAVMLDGNNEVSLLAWAVVESENEASWRFFLSQLKM